MRMPFSFVIRPKDNEQYINTKKVGDTTLIRNTSIEEAENVQRVGVVISLPLNYTGDIKVNDEVIVHHNVFRISYDGKGVPRESDFHIKDSFFAITSDLIFLVIRNGEKLAIDETVFVEPIKENHKWFGDQEVRHTGIIRYVNQKLAKSGVKSGDKIAFWRDCEYPFELDNEKLYKMANHRILAILE